MKRHTWLSRGGLVISPAYCCFVLLACGAEKPPRVRIVAADGAGTGTTVFDLAAVAPQGQADSGASPGADAGVSLDLYQAVGRVRPGRSRDAALARDRSAVPIRPDLGLRSRPDVASPRPESDDIGQPCRSNRQCQYKVCAQNTHNDRWFCSRECNPCARRPCPAGSGCQPAGGGFFLCAPRYPNAVCRAR